MTAHPIYIGLALLCPAERQSRIAAGVYRFAAMQPDWCVVELGHENGYEALDTAINRPFDGLIMNVKSKRLFRPYSPRLRESRIPVVNVSAKLELPWFATVDVDPGSVASAGITGLTKHCDQLGFVGVRDSVSSKQIQEGVEQMGSGGGAATLELNQAFPLSRPSAADTRRLTKWMSTLQRPAGILCYSDEIAVSVCSVAEDLKLVVPYDIAVISARDTWLCETWRPGISTVIEPHEQVGFRAASVLWTMMGDRTIIPSPRKLAADGILTRASSVPNVEHAGVYEALRFIRDNANRPINVTDVLQTLDMSREAFDRRFKEVVGWTPAAEIRRVRLELAQQYLSETDLRASEIAGLCGIEGASKFARFFKKETGMTPGEFRSTREST